MPKILPLYIVAAVAAGIAIYAGFTGRPVWFIHDTRMAVITLAAAGFLMCSTGAITSFVTHAPAHPLTIAGYLVGALALLAGLSQLFGWKVPYLADARTALIVITAAVVVKVIIARFANLVVK